MIGRVVLRLACSLLMVIAAGLHEMAGLGASIRAVFVLMGIQLVVGGLDAMMELDEGRTTCSLEQVVAPISHSYKKGEGMRRLFFVA